MNIDDVEVDTEEHGTTDAPAEATTDQPAAEEKPETGVAAFDKGLEELPESEGGVKAADAEKPGAGATGAAPVETQPGATAAAKPETPEDKEKAVRSALVEAELKKFNDELRAQGSKPLSKAAANRFRELSMRPTAEEFEKRVAEVEAKFAPREELAQTAERMNEVIAQTRANPDQLSAMFRYVGDINSRDPSAMKRAFDSMKAELTWLGEQIGEAVDGGDPLASHADLKQMVAEGDMKLTAALEVAQARATKRLHEQRSQEQGATQQQQRDYQAAIAKRDQDIAALDAHFKKTDPQYMEKLPQLAQTFAVLKQKNPDGSFLVHPSRWAAAIKEAYAQIKVQPKAAAAPASPPPLRSTGVTPPVMKIPKSGVAAFDMGLDALKNEAA